MTQHDPLWAELEALGGDGWPDSDETTDPRDYAERLAVLYPDRIIKVFQWPNGSLDAEID